NKRKWRWFSSCLKSVCARNSRSLWKLVLCIEGRGLCQFKDPLGRIAVLSCVWGTRSVGHSDLLQLLPFSEANPVLSVSSSSSALRSMIFHRKLLRFFLAAPQKAVVRLSGAEDCGAPLLGRLMIVGEKCAANLGLTNRFQMAVRYPPSVPSDYRAHLCILGGHQLGQPPG
uniref:Uncharacterized protein n=1 Tax=Gallus gallus TaxID=9031 RepID=A0A8V0YFE9_CHICK